MIINTKKELERIEKAIQHNKFNNDINFNKRADDNLVLDLVLKAKLDTKKFWESVKNGGGMDFKEEIKEILSTYSISLIE